MMENSAYLALFAMSRVKHVNIPGETAELVIAKHALAYNNPFFGLKTGQNRKVCTVNCVKTKYAEVMQMG